MRPARQRALTSPPNLREATHLLANQSDINYWLGCACAAAGDGKSARHYWSSAANFKGDFQQMSVRPFSEMTYYTAISRKKLGQGAKARRLFRDLLAYGRKLQEQPAKIDYFATSLPTMLLFEDDLQSRQETTALFLQAQAELGLGRRARARALVVVHAGKVVAAHQRSLHKGTEDLVLDHYLEILVRKPGAMPGSVALAQAKAAGVFTQTHQRFWDQARRRLGDGDGTKALIGVLLLHRALPAPAVLAGMTAAMAMGSVDPDVVAVEARRHLEGDRPPAPVVPIGARLAVRPTPGLARYDTLLAGGEAR